MLIRRIFLFLLALFCVPAHADTLRSALHFLGQSAMGIVAGRRAEEREYLGIVRIDLKRADRSTSLCSGFLVEGCIVTSGHCADDAAGASHSISFGSEPKGPVSEAFELKKWGKGKELATDLAVLKPHRPPPSEFSTTRDIIATEFPKKGDIIEIGGYGLSNTIEDPDTKKKVNVDDGAKRWGKSRVTNFSTTGAETEDAGPLFVSERAPSIVAPGDSGGPAIINGKIYGVATAVKPEYVLRAGEEPPKEGEELLVENITRANHLSFARPEAHKWLMDTLDELGCRTNTLEAVKLKLRDLVKDSFRTDHWKHDWEKRRVPAQEIVDTMKVDIRKLLNLPPGTEITISPTEYKNFTFDFSYLVGPRDNPTRTGNFKVEVDTGKVEFFEAPKVHSTINRATLEEANGPVAPPEQQRTREKLREPVYRPPRPMK